MGHGQKIVDSLKEAVAGNFARVTVGGVTWVRNDTHVDKATAWDELAKKNAEIERLREAIVMANNRLETALYKIGDETETCEHCIGLAKSYLQDAIEQNGEIDHE